MAGSRNFFTKLKEFPHVIENYSDWITIRFSSNTSLLGVCLAGKQKHRKQQVLCSHWYEVFLMFSFPYIMLLIKFYITSRTSALPQFVFKFRRSDSTFGYLKTAPWNTWQNTSQKQRILISVLKETRCQRHAQEELPLEKESQYPLKKWLIGILEPVRYR